MAMQTHTKRLKLYTPHEAQLAIHNSRARFRVASWGRQSGKSTYTINELVKRAWTLPGSRYWYISPTFAQAQQQYRRCVGMLMTCPEALLKKNQTELRVKFVNQSEIRFISGEVLHNLRGETLHGVGIDEVRDQHPDLWPMVIRPMLTTTQGFAIFISTPNGFDAFYDFYKRAETDKDWQAFKAPSTANPLFTQDEFEAARKEMSEDQFAQEIMAEFRDIGSGTCYVTFGQHNILEHSPFAAPGEDYSPYLPILVGMDFNLNPMSWVLGQQRNDMGIYWHDELVLRHTHTAEAAEILAQKVKHHRAGLTIIGDASGKAGQRAAIGGQSDYDVIKMVLARHGIKFVDKTPDSNPPIKDRVNTVNSTLRSADGSVHMWFNPRCKATIKDMQREAWKQNALTLAFDTKDPTIGHAAAAIGYAVCVLQPIRGVNTIGRVRVIARAF